MPQTSKSPKRSTMWPATSARRGTMAGGASATRARCPVRSWVSFTPRVQRHPAEPPQPRPPAGRRGPGAASARLGSEQRQNSVRAEWKGTVRHRQRVRDRVGDGGCGPDGSSLTNTFRAKLVDGRRRDEMLDLHRWHLARGRNEIVHEAAAEQLAVGRVADLLQKRGADALCHAADHLAVDDHRVDHGPAVVCNYVAADLD